ncbi:MAG TPA: hypothetical protein PKZ05_05655 [Bacteroidales bacterium]|nr:hypothetical protein [Bacteroidales bacterium]HQH14983.1 hypothetical protein [Bacteroidales bacterium]
MLRGLEKWVAMGSNGDNIKVSIVVEVVKGKNSTPFIKCRGTPSSVVLI